MTGENEKRYTKNDILDIKNQVSHLNLDQKDILDFAEIFLEWKECLKTKQEPNSKFKEIKIDNFIFTYEEFKKLIDNKLLSTQYYDENISEVKELQLLMEKKQLDFVFPSLAKNGIFNMMIYNLAKHSPTHNNVELHYITPENTNFDSIKEINNKIENIVYNSKDDGKAHFILTDDFSKKEDKSGHVVPYIIMDKKIFMFDSMGWNYCNDKNIDFYSIGSFLQQTDRSSCRAIAIREIDSFLKMLEKFDSIKEFSKYLEQFFPTEDKKIQFINPEQPYESLIDEPMIDRNNKKYKHNRRLGIAPLPILKFSQSISSLKEILDFSKILEQKCSDTESREKYKYILEMTNKLDSLIKRLETLKVRNNKVENEQNNEYNNINYYALRERIRHAKILSILYDKGLIKKLENINSYKNNEEHTAAIATVDNNWIDNTKEKTENNLEKLKNEKQGLTFEQTMLQNINTNKDINDIIETLQPNIKSIL